MPFTVTRGERNSGGVIDVDVDVDVGRKNEEGVVYTVYRNDGEEENAVL